jgi:hypothetical protein
MQIQDLIDGVNLVNYKTTYENMKSKVGHNHLDKHTFGKLFLLKDYMWCFIIYSFW